MNALASINHITSVTTDPHSGATYSDGMALFDVDHCGLVIVGRGHPLDLAFQVIKESGRDWRRLERLQRRYLDSLPGRPRASTIAVATERR